MTSAREILKIEAAGNDFIFTTDAHPLSRSEIVRLCDTHFGVGADGIVVMQRRGPSASRWQFYNRDGSEAAMCGNAARAAAAWLLRNQGSFPHQLETAFGNVELRQHPRGYSATISYADRPLAPKVVVAKNLGGFLKPPVATLVDTGVPHAVVEQPTAVLQSLKSDQHALIRLVEEFRWITEAGEAGANVTFFSRLSEAAIEAVTFERGVEDFTLSCGTGVLAAATVAAPTPLKGKIDVEVRNPGATLVVSSAEFPHSLTLAGPARVVFAAQVFE